VVAIRAENGASLPVYYSGQEVGRTDAAGAAHVVVSTPANSTFELRLGTDEPQAVAIRPRNPSTTFVVADRDDVLTLDQQFVVEGAHPAERSTHAARSPARATPIRIH
jgi:hypothetical protein